MAIYAYVGKPGAGKSYEVVNGPILKASESGRQVWTNVPVKIAGVHVVPPEQANDHWYLSAPPGALVVIDECWRYWPSGMTSREFPEEQAEFFTMHRHRTGDGYSTDIILVTQDLSQIASSIRLLVERTVMMTKKTALGTRNVYRVDVYDGAVTGQRPPERNYIGGQIKRYDPKGFERYVSHTQGGKALEVQVETRGNVWKRPAVLVIPLGILALLAVPKIVGGTITPDGSVQHPKPSPTPARTVTAAERVPVAERSEAPALAGPPPVPRSVGPQESSKWTLLGVIQADGGQGFAYMSNALGRRRVPLSECSQNEVGEWICKLDGDLVAQWTGNGMLQMAQGTTYNRKSGQ